MTGECVYLQLRERERERAEERVRLGSLSDQLACPLTKMNGEQEEMKRSLTTV